METKGKTLEEIDAIFEGEKHSSVPDVEAVRTGKEEIDGVIGNAARNRGRWRQSRAQGTW